MLGDFASLEVQNTYRGSDAYENNKQGLKQSQDQTASQASDSFLKKGLPEGGNQVDFIKAVESKIDITVGQLKLIAENYQFSTNYYREQYSILELLELKFLLGQLVTEPEKMASEEFLALIASIIYQYRETKIYALAQESKRLVSAFLEKEKTEIGVILFNALFKTLEEDFVSLEIASDPGIPCCFLSWVCQGEIAESVESPGWYVVRKNPGEPESNEFIFVATATNSSGQEDYGLLHSNRNPKQENNFSYGELYSATVSQDKSFN
ncbi:hypothetical protein [Piscirickettsia salmonis]|uniref:hypothetical protein n=1 Tax=Piscirickettsia salmonis TaxID=1238 RepID=UPI003A810F5C